MLPLSMPPLALCHLVRLRTSLTFSTKLSSNLCMLTLTTSAPFISFACNLCAQDFAPPAPGLVVSAIGAAMATPWRRGLGPCCRTSRRRALKEAMPWCLERNALLLLV
jgi:hypothetical protein